MADTIDRIIYVYGLWGAASFFWAAVQMDNTVFAIAGGTHVVIMGMARLRMILREQK